jgi:hypothetical protein
VYDELHPVAKSVNKNFAVPELTPVTIPSFVTDATEGLLLDQVPPVEGLSEVVAPIHICDGPNMDTKGFGKTVIETGEVD